jgi:hypothetical protein
MPTGLAGDYVWPLYENVDAELAGEGVELTDKKINLNKLRATPERIGIAVPRVPGTQQPHGRTCAA